MNSSTEHAEALLHPPNTSVWRTSRRYQLRPALPAHLLPSDRDDGTPSTSRTARRSRQQLRGEWSEQIQTFVSHRRPYVRIQGHRYPCTITALFLAIGDTLAREETVTIAGSGTFVIQRCTARYGRILRTGSSIAIAPSRVPSFKAGKTLRNVVNGSLGQRHGRTNGAVPSARQSTGMGSGQLVLGISRRSSVQECS